MASKYKGTRDAITICREMPTLKAYSKISIKNKNEMFYNEEGESSLLPFLTSRDISETLRLGEGLCGHVQSTFAKRMGRPT